MESARSAAFSALNRNSMKAIRILTFITALFSGVPALAADSAQANDQFGYSLAVSGDTVVVEAPFPSLNYSPHHHPSHDSSHAKVQRP
jgi:hypothetical protein